MSRMINSDLLERLEIAAFLQFSDRSCYQSDYAISREEWSPNQAHILVLVGSIPAPGSTSMNAKATIQTISDAELRSQVVRHHQEASGSGVLAHQLWATVQAGRALLMLKGRCEHGKFSALKTDGISAKTAERYMKLAKSPKTSHCDDFQSCKEIVDQHEWRSMRNVLDAHELVRSKKPSAKLDEPVADVEVEEVALCRYSGGYLVRVSVGTDPSVVAQRVEFAAETKDPGIARLVRDAVYRAFDAVGILPARSKSKWEAYKGGEATESDVGDVSDTAEGAETRELITRVVAQVEALNMVEEFEPVYSQLLATTM